MIVIKCTGVCCCQSSSAKESSPPVQDIEMSEQEIDSPEQPSAGDSVSDNETNNSNTLMGSSNNSDTLMDPTPALLDVENPPGLDSPWWIAIDDDISFKASALVHHE